MIFLINSNNIYYFLNHQDKSKKICVKLVIIIVYVAVLDKKQSPSP